MDWICEACGERNPAPADGRPWICSGCGTEMYVDEPVSDMPAEAPVTEAPPLRSTAELIGLLMLAMKAVCGFFRTLAVAGSLLGILFLLCVPDVTDTLTRNTVRFAQMRTESFCLIENVRTALGIPVSSEPEQTAPPQADAPDAEPDGFLANLQMLRSIILENLIDFTEEVQDIWSKQ